MTRDDLLKIRIGLLDSELGESRFEALAILDAELAKPEPEPVAWVAEGQADGQAINGKPRRVWWECVTGVGVPIYTAPPAAPAREWQDLSPLELRDTLRNCAASTFDKLAPRWYEVRQFAHAIESALKAKNTGEQA